MGPGAFRVGSVLGRSLRIWRRNVVPLTALAAIVYAPLVVFALLTVPTASDVRARGAQVLVYGLGLVFGWCLLWYIAPLAVIHGVLQQLRGERASFLGCLRVYLTRLVPTIGVSLLVGVLACLAMLPGMFVAGLMLQGGGPRALATFVGLFPAVLVGCVYWVAVPVAAVERPGILASLGRSAALTRGSRARTLAIVLVVMALQIAPTIVVRAVLPRRGSLDDWVLVFLALVTSAFGAVVTSVAYHDLRSTKEGVGVDDLVRVFA